MTGAAVSRILVEEDHARGVAPLARPDALVPIVTARNRRQPYDRDADGRLVREAVVEVVRRQTEAGVDGITDGGQGKA